ncbi:hypothetical protein NQ318_022469 [Aromia moschata]|uniref:DUF4817 domain-containing protein n=1 Tax=Aromia moschata TaxID=1265417 RepID=A0AAV8Z719_9CUCU|nr:hypothetical protein NQ318_022469 [Aromia moschata]
MERRRCSKFFISHAQVNEINTVGPCEISNTKYWISQSTVSRIENKFREFGNITEIPKSGRKRILDDEQKLDKPTRQVAAIMISRPLVKNTLPKTESSRINSVLGNDNTTAELRTPEGGEGHAFNARLNSIPGTLSISDPLPC